MQQIDLDRQLGYEPGKNGRKQRHIGIPAASRLVIALGHAPSISTAADDSRAQTNAEHLRDSQIDRLAARRSRTVSRSTRGCG